MSSLWGGRFEGGPDAEFARFNNSLPVDAALIEADVFGSKAWAQELTFAGVLSADEGAALTAGLDAVLAHVRATPDWLAKAIAEGVEDVHDYVESQLRHHVGALAGKLHTGRSRNDQVATDFRLHLKAAASAITTGLQTLRRALVAKAEASKSHALPGYTHLQRAQPQLWAQQFLSFFEMLGRDAERLAGCLERLDRCPLGSGAIAGTAYPIDRERLATALGFAAPTRNALDATSDRDFAIELVQTLAVVMMHLSRLAEDLILFSSEEFGFVSLADAYSTGSSLMPQKKNPDALELIRGKASRLVGHQTALLCLMKGLPSGYNKDLQEDKATVLDAVETTRASLAIMAGVIDTLTIHYDRAEREARRGFLAATDIADRLVRTGMPFREAHTLTGELVLMALRVGKDLETLSEEDYAAFHPSLSGAAEATTLEAVLAARRVLGGTAPASVRDALARAKATLSASAP